MMNEYKETSFGKIPTSWLVSKIEEIADVKGGKRLPKGESLLEEKTNHPYIRVADMFFGGINTNNILYVPNHIYPTIKNYIIEKDDLFISVAGTLGIVGEIPVELNGANLTENANKLTNISINKSFLLQVLLSPIIQNAIQREQTNNAQPKLALSRIRIFEVPNPPLPEQQKIAEILNTVDDKIEVIDQQITEMQELKKGLMQRLLTKGIGHTEFKDSALGRIPKSWEVIQIQTLLDNKRITSHLDGNHGGLYPKAEEFIDKGVPYIGANNFVNGKVDFDKCKHLSIERALKFRKGVAKNGDVLFAHNATVGPVAFLQTDLDFVILSTTATYFRLDNITINSKYWLYFISSPSFKNQYEKVMGQSTRNQVPITMQRSFLAILPDYSEQEKIANIISSVDEKLDVLLEKKTNYQELKQGLMQQLLTGKIRVKV